MAIASKKAAVLALDRHPAPALPVKRPDGLVDVRANALVVASTYPSVGRSANMTKTPLPRESGNRSRVRFAVSHGE